MDAVTLYQFELCPFCHKVKAAMEVKGIPFTKVEVNPVNKKELPALPEGAPRKVPVIQMGDETVFDSTEILAFFERRDAGASLSPADPARAALSATVERWVNEELARVLPTVIYGTWSEALHAAKIVARTSNFGFVHNAMVRAGGSLVMHRVAKRIQKERGGGAPEVMLAVELDKLEAWLGDDDFVGGARPCVGDVAAHGCLTCIAEFPAFETILARPRLAAWFRRVQALRDRNRARA
ncbi:MAG: glutathione S-transferase N-terminal domain-containing protein [Kofleriaceae bacterium]